MSDITTTTKLRILVTGAAGFIGFHVARRLLAEGHHVTGFDNLNPYYDVSLKQARLAELRPHGDFRFIEGDLAEVLDSLAAFHQTELLKLELERGQGIV